MRRLLVLIALSACVEPAPVQVTVLGGDDITVAPRDLCTWYEWLETRTLVPFIQPLPDHIELAGVVDPLEGSSEPCGIATCGPGSAGDTLVLHAQELHRTDGAAEEGAIVRIAGDNPAWCEWHVAVAVVR